MNQEGANDIVERAQYPFSFPILSRRVRARSAKKNAAASKEGRRGIVDELSAVIRLKTLDRQAELGVSIISKINNMCMNL